MARLTPYHPSRRAFPPLPSDLRTQWEAIVPSVSGSLQYRPCSAALKSGPVIPCVYVIDAQAYIGTWGVWPQDDLGKLYVDVEDVASISESPFRLPVRFANELYRAGESGMGYSAFTVVLADATEAHFTSGGALDFIALPDGRSVADIVRVIPHSGRGQTQTPSPKYYWCLFGSGEGRGGSRRFV
jgi:hypothetical protein